MASRYSKKHLLWLLPLILVLLLTAAVAGALTLAYQHGWRWQGLTWQQGPVLGRLAWRDGDCLRFAARELQLRDVWPVQLSVASVTVPSCEDGTRSKGAGFALPAAPPFDVVVRALRFRDYPALRVALHHRGSRWRAQASLKGSELQTAYDAATAHWQLTGRVHVARLRGRFSGIVNVLGSGYWHPGGGEADERFGGQLRLTGTRLGQAQGGPRANLMATVAWQGGDWTLDAALDQPLALGRGWVLQPGQGLHASGTGLTVRKATAELAALGPQGQALLSLRSHAGRLGSGQGNVVLSHGLSGRIDLSWADGELVVQPFAVTGPNGVILTLNEAVSMPLAVQGQAAPAVTVRYGDAQLSTTESHLSWGDAGVRWRGAVALDGRWRGYRLDGDWSGVVDRDGLRGEPLVAILEADNLHVRARLPVTGLWPPDWPLAVQLDGRLIGQPFTATVSAAHTDAGWGGDVQARSRLPRVAQGGELTLNGRWRWQHGLVLSSGARLSMARALENAVLIRPARLTATTAVRVGANGIRGRLRLDASGLTTARWRLPPLHGDLAFDGWHVDADLRMPKWNASLSIVGRDLAGAPNGTFNAKLPLQPAISRGLGFIARGGVLIANGHWRAGNELEVAGRLQARDVRLDWGSITASGVQADLDVSWQPGRAHISSRRPLTIGTLDTGLPVTDISLGLDSNLQTWWFHDIEASVFGGHLTASALTWPSTTYQPVALAGIDVTQLAALQSKPVVKVSGQVGGTIPLRLGRHSVAIRNGWLKNETPLTLSIPQTEGLMSLKKTNQAVDVALDALSPLRIDDFSARINMSADGWLKAAMTIQGVNPQRNLPIVLNYTHQENMYELLRSLRIGDRVVDAIMDNKADVLAPESKQ